MDIYEYLLELSGKGYYCAQIMMQLALDLDEKEDPDLLRAMAGLNGGLGFSGGPCGVLTAGCCFIGYFMGKGEDEELEAGEMNARIQDYQRWFLAEAVAGGCDGSCQGILGGDLGKQLEVCPGLIARSYEYLLGRLQETGVL